MKYILNKKKIKKIFRILFPVELSKTELFEKNLKSNKLISNFWKENSYYILEVENSFKVVLRDYNFSDYNVFFQIFNLKEYDLALTMLSNNSAEGEEMIIIDAGANVGYTSIFLSENLQNYRIYAIEPSKENYETYKCNIALSKCSEKIRIYNKALCERPNMFFNIERDFRDKKDWSITTNEAKHGQVKGISINEIIVENNLEYISLLKIDIEGAERFIFKLENDLSYLSITKIIVLEIHDEFQIRDKIYSILKQNGFFLFESGETTIGLNTKMIA